MPDHRPFSIYDEDEPEKSPAEPPKTDGLDLEMEGTGKGKKETPEKGSAPVPEATPSGTPFVKGRSTESLEDRTRDLLRRRLDEGKVRDRRKTASIFDKPIEPDKPMRLAKPSWHPLSHQSQALWFLAPAIFFFALFYLYPTLEGFRISLTHYSPLGKSVPVGWDNYLRAFQDTLFGQTVANAAAFTLLSLAIGFWPPILLAIFLNELPLGKGPFKVLYLLPFVIPAIPAANLWKWIFNEGYGVLNYLLQLAFPNLVPIGWLTDVRWALVSIVIMFVWKNTGWYMLIYFASLQNLPEELYEAAELDGAGILQKITHVTLPHLLPIMWILSIIQVLTTFQIFTEVYVMTNGGPMHSTEVIGTYIYKTAFGTMDMGYATAMAMIMFGVLFLFTIFRFLQIKKASR